MEFESSGESSGFLDYFLLIKRFNSHPRSSVLLENTTGVDRKKWILAPHPATALDICTLGSSGGNGSTGKVTFTRNGFTIWARKIIYFEYLKEFWPSKQQSVVVFISIARV